MIFSNPITTRELRARMRGIRAILPVVTCLIVLAVPVLLTFKGLSDSVSYAELAGQGRKLGFALLGTQLFLVLLLVPAYAASAIAVEREMGTYGVIRATLLTEWEFVSGKMLTGFSYAVLLAFSSLPLISLLFWMGGFDFTHLVWGFLITASTALLVTCTGIMVSTVVARSYLATGTTYGIVTLGTALGYVLLAVLGFWSHLSQRSVSSFGFDTVPVWIASTLNPILMLGTLDTGGRFEYGSIGGYYRNPMIEFFNTSLSHMHLPYAAVHVALSLVVSLALLILASCFLKRTSREDDL